MNKRGFVGPIGAIMLFMIFLVMYFVWLGEFIGDIGAYVVQTNNLTGIEAYFFLNLNFVVFVCMILGMLGWAYFGSTQ